MAPKMRIAGWNAFCGTIRQPGSCAMPMRVTTSRWTGQGNKACAFSYSRKLRSYGNHYPQGRKSSPHAVEKRRRPHSIDVQCHKRVSRGFRLAHFPWQPLPATGPFSVFPGIDSTLSVLAGDDIVLDIEGQATTLTRECAPLCLCRRCVLRCPPRWLGHHRPQCHDQTRTFCPYGPPPARQRHHIDASSWQSVLLFCAEGRMDLVSSEQTIKFEEHDCAVMTGCDALPLKLTGKGTTYLISIRAFPAENKSKATAPAPGLTGKRLSH